MSGRRTSISLENAVWDALGEICTREEMVAATVFSAIDQRRLDASLASALRVFTLAYYKVLGDWRRGQIRTRPALQFSEPSDPPPPIYPAALAAFETARRRAAKGRKLGRYLD